MDSEETCQEVRCKYLCFNMKSVFKNSMLSITFNLLSNCGPRVIYHMESIQA